MAAKYVFLFILSLMIISSTKASPDYPSSVEEFSGRFYKGAANQKDNKGKNVVLSALSADLVMSMVALGAQDDTQKEITKALFIDDVNAITPSIRQTIEELNNVKGVTLNLANKVYVKPSASGKLDSIRSTYRSTVEDVFKSEVQQLDFSNSVGSANEINGWVEAKTNNRIKNLISPDSLSELTAAVLVNAIYFKGTWAKKFDPAKTRPEDFTLADGTKVKVDMMNQKGKFLFKESPELDAKILVLPYENEEMSMVIILPNEVDGLEQLENKLVSGTKQYLGNLYEFEVSVSLPKYKIESTIDIKEVFEGFGVKRVFSPGESQLRGIMSDNSDLYVSKAVQKAFIEVNEEGAEAAAASGVVASYRSARYYDKAKFIADHPFYFEIREPNDVLFSGRLHQ